MNFGKTNTQMNSEDQPTEETKGLPKKYSHGSWKECYTTSLMEGCVTRSGKLKQSADCAHDRTAARKNIKSSIQKMFLLVIG